MKPNDSLQWTLCVHVWHARDFGHKIQLVTYRGINGSPKYYDGGTWKGLGVPESVLNGVRARLDAILTEHLIHRYGVAGELPVTWAGEPDPF